MPKSFERAPREVAELGEIVISHCYPDLHELSLKKSDRHQPLTIDYIMVRSELNTEGKPLGPALKLHGVKCAAIVRAIGQKDRSMGRGDAEIQIDGHWWDDADDDQREALLDHEICHIMPLKDAEGAWKRDDLGRIRLRMRLHDYDFGWFNEVARRRGHASLEVQQAASFYAEAGQLYFPFAFPKASVAA